MLFALISLYQEYLVPEEYVKTMRESMLNRCPVSSYDQVCDVIKKELGGAPDEVCKYCPFSPSYFNNAQIVVYLLS